MVVSRPKEEQVAKNPRPEGRYNRADKNSRFFKFNSVAQFAPTPALTVIPTRWIQRLETLWKTGIARSQKAPPASGPPPFPLSMPYLLCMIARRGFGFQKSLAGVCVSFIRHRQRSWPIRRRKAFRIGREYRLFFWDGVTGKMSVEGR